MGKAVVQTPIALGMLFSLALCWSLQNLWRASFGPLLEWLANLGISINASVIHWSAHPFRFAHTANMAIQGILTRGIAQSEKRFVRALNAVVEPFLLMVAVPVALALTLREGLEALWSYIKHQVPRVIHQTIVRPVERAVKATAGISRATFNSLAKKVQALRAQVRHIAASIPHAIPHVIPRLGHLERTAIDYARLHRWINRALLGALGASLTFAALRRLGLGWLRCKNVTKTAKRLCGMNADLLESLLASTLLLVGAVSLRQLARELEEPTKLATQGLSRLVAELPRLTDDLNPID